MPILTNPKHERFAQELAAGKTADEAYVFAGYAPSRKNASRLRTNEDISSRIEEILIQAATKSGATVERVAAELVKIGFSDIRNVVKWQGSLINEEDSPDGGETLVIKTIVTNHVQVIDSDKISDEAAAAISEVKQTKDGLSVKMHSKLDALGKLGQMLGMFKDRMELTGKNGAPLNIPITFVKPNGSA